MDEKDQIRKVDSIGQRTGGEDRLDDLSNKKCEADPLFPLFPLHELFSPGGMMNHHLTEYALREREGSRPYNIEKELTAKRSFIG